MFKKLQNDTDVQKSTEIDSLSGKKKKATVSVIRIKKV